MPWSSGLAWAVTAFMGLQSLGFYVVVTWLPQVLQDNGVSPAEAGDRCAGCGARHTEGAGVCQLGAESHRVRHRAGESAEAGQSPGVAFARQLQ